MIFRGDAGSSKSATKQARKPDISSAWTSVPETFPSALPASAKITFHQDHVQDSAGAACESNLLKSRAWNTH